MSNMSQEPPEWPGLIHHRAQYLAIISNIPDARPSDFEDEAQRQYDEFCERHGGIFNPTDQPFDADDENAAGGEREDCKDENSDADNENDISEEDLEEPSPIILPFIAETSLIFQHISAQRLRITNLQSRLAAAAAAAVGEQKQYTFPKESRDKEESQEKEELREKLKIKDSLIELMNEEVSRQRDAIEALTGELGRANEVSERVTRESEVKEGVIKDLGDALGVKNEEIARLRGLVRG